MVPAPFTEQLILRTLIGSGVCVQLGCTDGVSGPFSFIQCIVFVLFNIQRHKFSFLLKQFFSVFLDSPFYSLRCIFSLLKFRYVFSLCLSNLNSYLRVSLNCPSDHLFPSSLINFLWIMCQKCLLLYFKFHETFLEDLIYSQLL